MSQISAAKKTHPLFPTFSASVDSKLNKLVSTPEIEDAFKKYPKSFKGVFEIDYSKYPNINRNETPWEYAYRTQTPIDWQLKSTKNT